MTSLALELPVTSVDPVVTGLFFIPLVGSPSAALTTAIAVGEKETLKPVNFEGTH